MQQRPLHMVLLKSKQLPKLFGHCLSPYSNTPALTITTHRSHDDQAIWYLGGQLAETGVTLSEPEQITAAQTILSTLFPWLDYQQMSWKSFFINRAEAKQPGGTKPNSITCHAHHNILTAWPTKLAFAPHLANQILRFIQSLGLEKQDHVEMPHHLPKPTIATPIWNEI